MIFYESLVNLYSLSILWLFSHVINDYYFWHLLTTSSITYLLFSPPGYNGTGTMDSLRRISIPRLKRMRTEILKLRLLRESNRISCALRHRWEICFRARKRIKKRSPYTELSIALVKSIDCNNDCDENDEWIAPSNRSSDMLSSGRYLEDDQGKKGTHRPPYWGRAQGMLAFPVVYRLATDTLVSPPPTHPSYVHRSTLPRSNRLSQAWLYLLEHPEEGTRFHFCSI